MVDFFEVAYIPLVVLGLPLILVWIFWWAAVFVLTAFRKKWEGGFWFYVVSVCAVLIAVINLFVSFSTASYISSSVDAAKDVQVEESFPYTEEELVPAFQEMFQIKMKGSHPTTAYNASVMIDGKERGLTLYKDSRESNLYWVKYDAFFMTPQIGFIRFEKDSFK